MKTAIWRPQDALWKPCQDETMEGWTIPAVDDTMARILTQPARYSTVLSVLTVIALNPTKKFVINTNHSKEYKEILHLGFLPRDIYLRAEWLVSFGGPMGLDSDNYPERQIHYREVIKKSIKGSCSSYFEWFTPVENLYIMDITEPSLFEKGLPE